jgi:hypothetical protein
MCDFDKGFILCTCEEKKPIIHNKKSRRYKGQKDQLPTIYRWYLSSFTEYYDSIMEGIYKFPVADIGKGLTEEWVLLHLNAGNCFDFEYTPQEGDNLIIKSPAEYYQYLSFIFKSGQWQADHYNAFNTILSLIKNGEVKELNDNT